MHSTIQPPDAETGPAEVQRNHVVSLEIILVRPHTTYHYRLVAKNQAGKAYGRDRTFRTRRHYSSSSCL
jgi:hypothetical protein